MDSKKDVLAATDFGQRVAEDEGDSLSAYFVETDNWSQVLQGGVDVVYGPKGSGKSALYSLLIARTNELFDRGVMLIPAENPRGTPAFRDLETDPPASEFEFASLWKLYFLSLIASAFDEYGIDNEEANTVRDALVREGLVEGSLTLRAHLRNAFDYVKSALRPNAVEADVKIDPLTQLPVGFGGKISFNEPSTEGRQHGIQSVDYLLTLANQALLRYGEYDLWLLLDRLDVAFDESSELEKNALRALFRVYLDLAGFERINIKIFLRTDIWNRISKEGFREASHITRHVTISWNRSSLLNLIVRRAMHNDSIRSYYSVDSDAVLQSVENQETFFFRAFPDQVERGPNKSTSLDWLLSRTQDGTQVNAPRELIHMLNALRAEQMRRFELGESEPDDEALFTRAAFKSALPEVSETRLRQTVYAEYPELKSTIEHLRGEKTLQRVSSLANIFNTTEEEARSTASRLVEVGIFESRGSKASPEYWVPFLYRDALEMVQGTAD